MFRILYLFLYVMTSFLCCTAQNMLPNKHDSPVFTVVEQMPEFPGGEKAMFKFVSTNIEYPMLERVKEIQGKVYVSFVIDTSGTVVNAKVLRGISRGCDEEALRVVRMMPK